MIGVASQSHFHFLTLSRAAVNGAVLTFAALHRGKKSNDGATRTRGFVKQWKCIKERTYYRIIVIADLGEALQCNLLIKMYNVH